MQARIEKYLEIPRNELNKEQKQALERIGEVRAVYKEYEEIIKQLKGQEALEAKLQRQSKVLQLEQEELRLQQAVQEATVASQDRVKSVIEALYALNIAHSEASQEIAATLAEQEHAALSSLRGVLHPPTNLAPDALESHLTQALEHLHKHASRSEEEFTQGMSYSDVNQLISRVLQQATAENVLVIETNSAEEFAEEIAATAEMTGMTESEVVQELVHQATVAAGLEEGSTAVIIKEKEDDLFNIPVQNVRFGLDGTCANMMFLHD